MIDSISFRARARTIDQLGREQIADCATAISELWKNAYDAYARTVGLHIYDSDVPIAVLVDDGHGMSRDDFIEKWLVVGTESKASAARIPDDDRNGLAERPKQGQKGIGRLSSAFLGSLLLLISKRPRAPYVAALIDWRLFENPFIFLQDIEIPVVEIDGKAQILAQLPALFDALMGNLRGSGKDAARDERIIAAWRTFDALESANGVPFTREAIEGAILDLRIEERHFQQWPLWRDESDHGTILLIANIVFDLEAQIGSRVSPEDAAAAEQAQARLRQTLSSFTDPFADPGEVAAGYGPAQFDYSVKVWEGALLDIIVSSEREFDLRDVENMEHVVRGQVDGQGIFTGQVKAFGQWLSGDIRIDPIGDVPSRSNSRIGPFHLLLCTFQQNPGESSHPADFHRWLSVQTELYSGLMLYRNGLRVMPYGREDNDFFEIEKRRSKHAGRFFWSNRRLFGRVAITREGNPNLRDKAGREGLIDNKAAKVFRDLVENILIKTAYNYFGTGSEIQQRFLPGIREARAQEKAEEERKRQRASKRKRFRTELRRLGPQLLALLNELEMIAEEVRTSTLGSEVQIVRLRERLSGIKGRSKELTLGDVPRVLGTLEEDYRTYRFNQRKTGELLIALERSLTEALDAVKPRAPREIAYSELSSHAAFLQHRLRRWQKEARDLLESEQRRIADIYESRSKLYHARTLPILDGLEQGRIALGKALEMLERERDQADLDSAEIFEPYIRALQTLHECIDLDAVASYSMDAVDELQDKLAELHALAQLGITVEIIGHEIEGFEASISAGLKALPASVQATETFATIQTAHDSLADRLRFLSPLKLSGDRVKTTIGGTDIVSYVRRFFGDLPARNGIEIEATDSFLRLALYEQPSRIYPVFINLVNNSLYWVRHGLVKGHRVLLDVVDQRVVVADDGPGVDEDDLKHLFTLFWTRKVRGGRGVGLYLCRANLAAGGHTIEYASEGKFKLLSGANFVIDFAGPKYE